MTLAPALAALGLGLVMSTSPAVVSASIVAPAEPAQDAGAAQDPDPDPEVETPNDAPPSLGDSSTDITDRAKQAFDAGLSAVEGGEFERAVDAFEQAYRLRPHPVALFNLALALERAERRGEAWELFEATLDIVESQRERDEIRSHLDTLGAQVAVLEIKAAPRERLCFDDLALPERETHDYRIAIEPGSHTLLFDEHELKVDLVAGERRLLLLDAHNFSSSARPSRIAPAMSGVAIGTGVGALGLGIGAALVSEPSSLRVGLAAGAAASAGVAVTASIIALVAQTERRSANKGSRARQNPLICAGAPALGERLDIELLPQIDGPIPYPTAQLMPPLAPRLPEAATSLLATRPQKRPLTTTP